MLGPALTVVHDSFFPFPCASFATAPAVPPRVSALQGSSGVGEARADNSLQHSSSLRGKAKWPGTEEEGCGTCELELDHDAHHRARRLVSVQDAHLSSERGDAQRRKQRREGRRRREGRKEGRWWGGGRGEEDWGGKRVREQSKTRRALLYVGSRRATHAAHARSRSTPTAEHTGGGGGGGPCSHRGRRRRGRGRRGGGRGRGPWRGRRQARSPPTPPARCARRRRRTR
eukprot:3426067-Rhodomonas_salina.1